MQWENYQLVQLARLYRVGYLLADILDDLWW
jgi:hypothetical protein